MNELRAWFASETDGRTHLALEAGFAWLLVLATANLYRYDEVFFAGEPEDDDREGGVD